MNQNRIFIERFNVCNGLKVFCQILFLQILNCVPSQTEIVGYRADAHVLPKL